MFIDYYPVAPLGATGHLERYQTLSDSSPPPDTAKKSFFLC